MESRSSTFLEYNRTTPYQNTTNNRFDYLVVTPFHLEKSAHFQIVENKDGILEEKKRCKQESSRFENI